MFWLRLLCEKQTGVIKSRNMSFKIQRKPSKKSVSQVKNTNSKKKRDNIEEIELKSMAMLNM